MIRLRAGWAIGSEAKDSGKKRGMAAQVETREMERLVRMGAVALARWARLQGRSRSAVAAAIGMLPATLADWEEQWEEDRMAVQPRGRKCRHVDRWGRRAIFAVFDLTGPGVPLATLEDLFPNVARRELEALATEYRSDHHEDSMRMVYALRWNRAHTVWAIDFTEAECPIDGEFPYILVVRDLGTGMQLLALPTRDESAQVVHDALTALFLAYGPPLVLKSDNGGGFRAAEIEELLRAWKVEHLLSPPYLPSYNGAAEAGIGSLKTRIHYESARHDRPGQWTSNDVETARLMANETTRPHGRLCGTPDQMWAARRSPEDIRDPFRRTVAEATVEVRAKMGYAWEGPLDKKTQDSINRTAITRALVERELLSFRRRSIRLPIRAKKVVKIT